MNIELNDLESVTYHLWERVDKLLENRNMNLQQFSKSIGVSYNTIRGQRTKSIMPKNIQLYKMARTLNSNIEFLLTGEVIKKKDPTFLMVKQNPILMNIVEKLVRLSPDKLQFVADMVQGIKIDEPKHQNQVG